ncbi:hypothetical protein GPECTOR_76g797 [Gonium pectorale]|uniref:Uncharacterized protein n=1 Tax=Gonium pectorale TaxID=33097 RepID=A0A150G288_GONPE|nr:hypothetical protein GPECTOR_76g797 [Gonium pectorale]|eukprot:KXZ43976.1 hypothetical protein GPECTOR_76g797 [Gonium pectorale]
MALRQSGDDLISALQKGEATLEQIARKLEEEADRRFCKPGTGLVDAAQRQLAANHSHLKQLCEAAGAQPPDDEAFRSLQESVAEWNSKLNRGMQAATAGQQQYTRHDLNAALARIAMTTD